MLSACEQFVIRIEYLWAYSLGLALLVSMIRNLIFSHRVEMEIYRGLLGVVLIVALLNLRGIPPFLGFFVKLEILNTILLRNQNLIFIRLLRGAMIFTYIYLRLFFRFLVEATNS